MEMQTKVMRQDVLTILSEPLPWHSFFGRTVLITGAGGALASYLVGTLLALNDLEIGPPCHVVAMVRDVERARRRLSTHLDRADFTLLAGDVVDPIKPTRTVDFIIHAASPATGREFAADPVGTLRANIVGTDNLLQLAKRDQSQGFLFLSSGEVYGETGDRLISEVDYGYMDPATVRACYGEGKRAAETMCVTYAHQYGVPTYIARIMHSYGPQIDLSDGRIYSDFAADILARRDLKIMSDGRARRPFCYVTDAIIGLFTIMLRGKVAHPYNMGNDEEVWSIKELADRLTQEAFPELQLSVDCPASVDKALYPKSHLTGGQPDLSRLRALGWSPKVDVVKGFRRTIASLTDEALLA
jgi:nucleoside-diphosphate-sugar epimerase